MNKKQFTLDLLTAKLELLKLQCLSAGEPWIGIFEQEMERAIIRIAGSFQPKEKSEK